MLSIVLWTYGLKFKEASRGFPAAAWLLSYLCKLMVCNLSFKYLPICVVCALNALMQYMLHRTSW